MNTYLISYDLRLPEKNYPALHEHIKNCGNWAKPLESVWLIKSSQSAEQIRNGIQQHVDGNDKVLVIDVTSRAAAWVNLTKDVNDWIHSQL